MVVCGVTDGELYATEQLRQFQQPPADSDTLQLQ